MLGLPILRDDSTPTFADWDGDSIPELFIGTKVGDLHVFHWNGENWNENLDLSTGIPAFEKLEPTLWDLDNDGTLELITGDVEGKLWGFEWEGTKWTNNPAIVSGLADVGSNSTPEFVDINGDNVPELFIGNLAGVFYGYSRSGENWVENENLTVGLTDVGLYSDLAFGDINSDGNIDLVSGEEYGNFYGFSWTGENWVENSSLVAGLTDVGGWSSPAIADINGDGPLELISGEHYGYLTGFSWTGENWVENSSLISKIYNLGSNSVPAFADLTGDGVNEIITGEHDGVFYGYYWDGSRWFENSSLVAGLSDIGARSTLALFDFDNDGLPEMMTGNHAGEFQGFHWTGENWIDNSSLVAGLSAIGDYTFPALVDMDQDGILELIVGKGLGTFRGYSWVDNQWVENSALVNGLAAGMFPRPTLADFNGDNVPELLVGSTAGFSGFSWVGDNWLSVPLFASGLGGGAPILVDLDNDGLYEVVTGDAYGAFSGYRIYPFIGTWKSPWYHVKGATRLNLNVEILRREYENVLIGIETSDENLVIKENFEADLRFGYISIDVQPAQYARVVFYLQTGASENSPNVISFRLQGSSRKNSSFGGDVVFLSQDNWGAGSHDNTRFFDNQLTLEAGRQRGSWVSPWSDFGKGAKFENIAVDVIASQGENVRVSVEVSHDAVSVDDSLENIPLPNGTSIVDISSIAETRYLRVRFEFETPTATPGVTSFSVASIPGDRTPPEAPILVSPENGSTQTQSTVNLDWNSTPENSLPVYYYVEVSDNPEFPYENDNSGWITGDSWSTSTLSQGTWYWRVRAKDNAGNEGEYSGYRTFTISLQAQSSPATVITTTVLSISPLNFDLVLDNSITLTATLKSSQGTPLSGKSLRWSTDAGVLSATTTTTDASGQTSVAYTASNVSSENVTVTVSFAGTSDYLASRATSGGTITLTPKEEIELFENLIENLEERSTYLEISFENENIAAFENAFFRGDIGAYVNVTSDGNVSTVTNGFLHQDVSIEVKVSLGEMVEATVSSDVENGKTVAFDIDNKTLRVLHAGDVRVLFDNEEISQAEDYEDILDPADENFPEYLVLLGNNGTQVLVSVPKFSTHKITITTLPTQPFVTAPPYIVIFFAAGSLLVATIFLVWRRVSVGASKVKLARRHRRQGSNKRR